MHVHLRRVVLLTMALVLCASAASALAEERIAVLEFTGRKVNPDLVTMLAERARQGALAAARGSPHSVMTRENTVFLVKQNGGLCTEGECEVETGKLIGASLVVTGSVSFLAKTWVVDLKIHDTARGRLLDATSVDERSELALLKATLDAARAMVAGAIASAAPPPAAAAPAAPQRLAPPMAPPPEPARSSTPAPRAGSARIGVVNTSSGVEKPIADHLANGYRLAQEDLRARGLDVQLVWEDDGGKPPLAMAAMERLAGDGVAAVVGPYTSASAHGASKLAESLRVPLLVPAAAKEEITRQGNAWVFRLNAPASVYGPSVIDAALAAGEPAPRSIALLYEGTDFGRAVAGSARAHAERRGLRVAADEVYQKGTRDFRAALERATGADLVFMVSYVADAIQLMRQAREMGLSPKAFLGGGAGFDTSQFLSEPISESVFAVSQWSADARWPGAAEFAERYRARFGTEPTYHAAMAYEALRILAEAAIRAGGDRARLRDELAGGTWQGLTGPVDFADFDGFTNQNRHEMVVKQVVNRRYEAVHPPAAAARPPVYPFRGW